MPTQFYLASQTNKTGERRILISVHIKGVRALTSIGYSISPENWNEDKGQVKKGAKNSKGIDYLAINSRIHDLTSKFESLEAHEATPTKEEILMLVANTIGRGSSNEPESTLFFLHYDEFLKDGRDNQHWALNTYKKWITLRKHLEKFNPFITFDSFDKETLDAYVHYCATEFDMLDVSVTKELSLMRWYLNWAAERGYHNNMVFKHYRAKLKDTKKPVIFLTNEELLKLYTFKIPKNGTEVTLHHLDGTEYKKTVAEKSSLDKVRDLFCFCAFTSLRYSDMANLKRTDIYDGAIHVTTIKTDDPVVIEINSRAQKILDKYKDFDFDDLALPVITNQKMNMYLKEICELCEFNSPVTVTSYLNGVRGDYVFPKWQLIGTHAARRTFICHALSAGIPPQVVMKWTGHSDYKAMKPYIDIAEQTKATAMEKFDKAFNL